MCGRAGGRAGERASGRAAGGRACGRAVGPYGWALTCCGGAGLPSAPAGAGGKTCAPVSVVITVGAGGQAGGLVDVRVRARTRVLLPASSGALPCANVRLPRERCRVARRRVLAC